MLCGESGALKALEEAQAAMKDAISQGMAALDEIEAQAEAALASLSEIKIELPELPDLQGELAKLQDMLTDPLGFASKLAEIKAQFGDAVDDFEAMIADLGLDDFPPDLSKLAANICDIPNKQVSQDGTVVDKPPTPVQAKTFPVDMPPKFEPVPIAVQTKVPETVPEVVDYSDPEPIAWDSNSTEVNATATRDAFKMAMEAATKAKGLPRGTSTADAKSFYNGFYNRIYLYLDDGQTVRGFPKPSFGLFSEPDKLYEELGYEFGQALELEYEIAVETLYAIREPRIGNLREAIKVHNGTASNL